jgi:oxygen-independent coproporphyrinogen-3 oxidase
MLTLYIHIPFCVQKCPYCGFYSTGYSSAAADRFLDALEREALTRASRIRQRVIDTIYIGGGTPSVLSVPQTQRLMRSVRSAFTIARDVEWTVEVNSNSADTERLTAWRDGGANRLSIGMQSLDNGVLGSLGRVHTAEQAREVYARSRSLGFGNVSIDLMYGIPGQTEAQWTNTLASVLEMRPEHVSVYSLSLDEGSRFSAEAAAGRFALPDDDRTAAMYEQAAALLMRYGYERYELSNFALPGRACRHNSNYWARGEYFGLGPGAWSFLDGSRYRTVPDVPAYTEYLLAGKPAIDFTEAPGPLDAVRETMMLGLRTALGVDVERITCGLDAVSRTRLEQTIRSLVQAGLLCDQEGRIVLTDRGILLSNEVLARLAD